MTGFPVPQPVVADQETEKGANSAQTGGGQAGEDSWELIVTFLHRQHFSLHIFK